MQLVIDIDEDYYRIIKHDVEHGMDYLPCVLIANGTSLPKGHGRLIDADEVIKIANKTKDLHGAIWNTPTIIEADKAESEDKE